MAVELKSDADFHMFGQQYPHAVIIVLKDGCGACVRFKEGHLDGVLRLMQVEGIPVGIANWADLSPQLRGDTSMFKSWPAILYVRNGWPQQPQYLGDRTPAVLVDWVKKRMADQV